MVTSSPRTPDEYIASLPAERRDAIAAARADLDRFVAFHTEVRGSSRTSRAAS